MRHMHLALAAIAALSVGAAEAQDGSPYYNAQGPNAPKPVTVTTKTAAKPSQPKTKKQRKSDKDDSGKPRSSGSSTAH